MCLSDFFNLFIYYLLYRTSLCTKACTVFLVRFSSFFHLCLLPSSSTIICAFSLASVIALHLAFSIFGTDRSAFSALQASSNLRATSILHRLYANFSRETWVTLRFRWRKLSFLTINYFVGNYLTQLIFVLSVPFVHFCALLLENLFSQNRLF